MQSEKEFLLRLAQLDATKLTSKEQERKDLLKRSTVTKALVMVNSSTSGMVAGAGQTMEAIKQYVADRSLDIELAETGSLGLSSEEPVVSVQMPGRTRIFFRKVSADKVSSILDDLIHQVVPGQLVIGQLRHEGQEAWNDVPFLDEIPFFALQNRIVMGSCGIIDPFSFGEYVANGGTELFCLPSEASPSARFASLWRKAD